MKISKIVIGLLATCIAAAMVIWGAIALADHLSEKGKVASKCGSGQHELHLVNIQKDTFSPAYIEAKRCDTMKITNLDNRNRLVAFGTHDRHIPYDGITERYLLRDESFTVTLNKTGEYLVHDHNQDEVKAEFTVR